MAHFLCIWVEGGIPELLLQSEGLLTTIYWKNKVLTRFIQSFEMIITYHGNLEFLSVLTMFRWFSWYSLVFSSILISFKLQIFFFFLSFLKYSWIWNTNDIIFISLLLLGRWFPCEPWNFFQIKKRCKKKHTKFYKNFINCIYFT